MIQVGVEHGASGLENEDLLGGGRHVVHDQRVDLDQMRVVLAVQGLSRRHPDRLDDCPRVHDPHLRTVQHGSELATRGKPHGIHQIPGLGRLGPTRPNMHGAAAILDVERAGHLPQRHHASNVDPVPGRFRSVLQERVGAHQRQGEGVLRARLEYRHLVAARDIQLNPGELPPGIENRGAHSVDANPAVHQTRQRAGAPHHVDPKPVRALDGFEHPVVFLRGDRLHYALGFHPPAVIAPR